MNNRSDLAFLAILVLSEIALPAGGAVLSVAWLESGLEMYFLLTICSTVFFLTVLEILSKRPLELSGFKGIWTIFEISSFQNLQQLMVEITPDRPHLAPKQVAFTGQTCITVGLRFKSGPLGMPTRFLILGKPLLHLISVNEFRAVIAHELFHTLTISKYRLNSWIFDESQVNGLSRIVNMFSVVRAMIRIFIANREEAGSVLELARERELECDRFASLKCGEDAVASAIVSMQRIMAAKYMHLPHALYDSVSRDPNTIENYVEFVSNVISSRFEDHYDLWVDYNPGSHPSVGQRLSSLNAGSLEQYMRPGIELIRSADHYYLAGNSDMVEKLVDKAFVKLASRCWKQWNSYCSSVERLSDEATRELHFRLGW